MKKLIILLITFIIAGNAFANQSTINIAYTIDNNYPIFTLLSINSILLNNKTKSDYKFYIIEDNITDKNKELMRNYVNKRNQSIEFIHIDPKTIDDGTNYYTYSNRITPIAMARILLSDLLPKDVHKVLYIDGDTLITDDLKPLYEINLKGKPAGMCNQYGGFPDTYHNSGVILMDLDVWRKKKLSDKAILYLKTHKQNFIYKDGDTKNKFLFPDQDLINIVLRGQIKTLPNAYNNQTENDYIMRPENLHGIIHYVGPIKPWHFPPLRIEPVKMYYKYWNKSELKRYKYYYALIALKKNYLKELDYKISRYIKGVNLSKDKLER